MKLKIRSTREARKNNSEATDWISHSSSTRLSGSRPVPTTRTPRLASAESSNARKEKWTGNYCMAMENHCLKLINFYRKWCYVENLVDPKNPYKDCYNDVLWWPQEAAYYSYDACVDKDKEPKWEED